MPCYLSGAPVGGHASISDDGSGNVLIAEGKDLHLVGTGGRVRVPPGITSSVSVQNNVTPATGFDTGGNPSIQRGGTSVFTGVSGQSRLQGISSRVDPEVHLLPSDPVAITSVNTVITIESPWMKLAPDGVYALVNPVNGTTDGRYAIFENTSAFLLTLQEGITIASGEIIQIVYSADAGSYVEL